LIAQLKEEEVARLSEHKQRLVDNTSNTEVLIDLIFEARAARADNKDLSVLSQ
jgi:hypothetical protein